MSISMALEVLGSSGTFKATGRVASPEIFDSSATWEFKQEHQKYSYSQLPNKQVLVY